LRETVVVKARAASSSESKRRRRREGKEREAGGVTDGGSGSKSSIIKKSIIGTGVVAGRVRVGVGNRKVQVARLCFVCQLVQRHDGPL